MTHKIYVYGTLMPMDGREKVKLPGRMYDLGWFPGVVLSEATRIDGVDLCGKDYFLAEIIEVDDDRLAELDKYEGYYEGNEEASLYIRRPFRDGWIYEYNRSCCSRDLIKSGNWPEYYNQRRAA